MDSLINQLRIPLSNQITLASIKILFYSDLTCLPTYGVWWIWRAPICLLRKQICGPHQLRRPSGCHLKKRCHPVTQLLRHQIQIGQPSRNECYFHSKVEEFPMELLYLTTHLVFWSLCIEYSWVSLWYLELACQQLQALRSKGYR